MKSEKHIIRRLLKENREAFARVEKIREELRIQILVDSGKLSYVRREGKTGRMINQAKAVVKK